MFIVRRLVSPSLNLLTRRCNFILRPKYQFAFMSLFQQPKKPQQLSNVFKKSQRLKGHLRNKNRKGYISPKLNQKVKQKPLRLKNHRGMLKRIKIVGPHWNRQFKRLHAQNYHLKRKKSLGNLRRKKLKAYISKADIWRVRRLIPYFKRKSLKNMY